MNNRTRSFFNSGRTSFLSCALLVLALIAVTASVKGATAADFDGDGRADLSVFRPSDGFWYVAKSSGGFSSVSFGRSTDKPVPGDYDGDRKTDVAVYRQGSLPNWENTWYVLGSSDGQLRVTQWVRSVAWWEHYSAVTADFDGDGKTDLSVYRLTDAIGEPGRFVIQHSSTSARIDTQLGTHFFRQVPADYDGDRRADYAVFKDGVWSVLQSSDGSVRTVSFGLSGDLLTPADYDGDGRADIAVWRPSNGFWYRINSRDNSFYAMQFGLPDDKPTPADYDGDGRTDIGVFRTSNGVWYSLRSTTGFAAQQFGQSGDIPIPNTFVR